MIISFFALILIAAFIGIGLGALWLLSRLISMLTDLRSRPRINAHRQLGLFISALVGSVGLVTLIVISGLYSKRSQSMPMAENMPHKPQQLAVIGWGKNTVVDQDSKPPRPPISLEPEAVSGIKGDMPVPANVQNQNVASANETATVDARKLQLKEMMTGIGEFLRSQLEKVGDKSAVTTFGQAAKSDNGDVVIFQPSDEMVQQILGAGGQDLLKSLNLELPGRIRQTYALIPLTPPVGTTVPMQPLIANRGLEMLANSIVSLVGRTDGASSSSTPEAAALTAEADGTLTVAPELRPEPDWMSKTEGRRIIAKSEPVFPGDDSDAKLTAAINNALARHVEAVAASMDPAILGHAKLVHMELPQAIASRYIVDQYERQETMDSEVGGKTEFKLLYALVEFPDTIDQVAVRQIRYAIQNDRIIGLGVVVGSIWLSVCSAGFGIRQWQKGTKLRRIAATPVFAMITIPTLLLTVAMVFALAKGEAPQGPWNENPVTIDLANI